MKHVVSVGIVAVGLLLPAVGYSDTASAPAPSASLIPFAVQADPLQQQCLLEHTQVQSGPVPQRRVLGNLAAGGPQVWHQSGGRPGSEHWNIADLQRACRSQWTRSAAAPSGVVSGFLLTP